MRFVRSRLRRAGAREAAGEHVPGVTVAREADGKPDVKPVGNALSADVVAGVGAEPGSTPPRVPHLSGRPLGAAFA